MGKRLRTEAFISRWCAGEGGAERANYALFLVELIDLLDLPHPDPAGATHENNDYVFERAVRLKHLDGNTSIGRIDFYRRGSFVLEAKQSRWKDQSKPERPREDGSGTELPNPERPEWPEADYIVGNPPFMGGKDMRGRLPNGYAAALWKAHPHINKSADFVMYWWDHAADLLARKGSRLKRFGFVTTNSITQEFSRRVITRRMEGRPPLHLAMAIPDHPWTKATPDSAAVRIAMTVAAPGHGDGILREVAFEAALDSDQPRIDLVEARGRINADLTVGTDITGTVPLRANAGLSSPGVKLHGAGFNGGGAGRRPRIAGRGGQPRRTARGRSPR